MGKVRSIFTVNVMEEKRCIKTVKREDITKEGSQASPDRLIALRIVIALAMTEAGLQGKTTKLQGLLKYVFFPQETGITRRRPSNFWRGLSRENWLIAFDSSQEWVESMLSFVCHKKSFYQRERRAIKLIGNHLSLVVAP